MIVNVLTDDKTTVQVLQSSLPNVIEVVAIGPQGPAGSAGAGDSIDTGSFATTSSLQDLIDVTGSFATTSSLQGLIDVTGSFATTGSNSFVGSQVITGSLTVSGSSTFINIGPTVLSGSVTSTQGFTGSLQGTASFATTASYALNAGVTIETGSFATTGSNTFTGSQVMLSNGGASVLDLHTPNDNPYTFRMYNDTYSTTVPVFSGFGYNDGRYAIGNEADTSIEIYTNADYFNPTLIISSSEITSTSPISASVFKGDGSGLYNLPSPINWNKGKEYTLRRTEQLTFSGDYILENTNLIIEGGELNNIGEWVTASFNGDTTGTITPISSSGYLITGPTVDGNAYGLQIYRLFDTATTMSINYVWEGEDVGVVRPYYEVNVQEPTEPNTASRLQDTGSISESGSWTINVPSGSWLAIGVWTDNSNGTSSSLQLTLPYIVDEDIIQYSTGKYFKKEGTVFIGGNLLVKDSTIENNGKISVGGEVILIGNSEITGTGTII